MMKKIGVIAAAMICVIAMGVPVQASYLDVKAGDTDSLRTVKDGGSNWDNYFYVSPTTYYGTVHAKSFSYGTSSPYYKMSHINSRYSYVKYAPPGKTYWLHAYGSPSDWHLIGRYTS